MKKSKNICSNKKRPGVVYARARWIQMKHDFNDIIFEIEVNEVYQIDKFTQMVIEYPELLEKANKKADF